MARRAREQEALFRFTDRLYRAGSLSDSYDAALSAIVGTLDCKAASILRFDRDGVMRFVAWHGLSDNYRKAVDGHSPWTQGEAEPEPIFIADIDQADLPDDIARQHKIRRHPRARIPAFDLRGQGVRKVHGLLRHAAAISSDGVSISPSPSRASSASAWSAPTATSEGRSPS